MISSILTIKPPSSVVLKKIMKKLLITGIFSAGVGASIKKIMVLLKLWVLGLFDYVLFNLFCYFFISI